jgi:hypothetical protein
VTCRECRQAEVPAGQGTVCSTCRPKVRRRSRPIAETLAMIDAALAGGGCPEEPCTHIEYCALHRGGPCDCPTEELPRG